MIVYRLASKDYIHDIQGVGARLYGGRWKPVGVPCIYTSESVSLAFLEKYVHAKAREDIQRIALLKIELNEKRVNIFKTDHNLFKSSWHQDYTYSQWLGQQILADISITAFSVPSAIVPFERNIILNPAAENFNLVRFFEPIDFAADFRLLSKLL
jgi:RES domain-containing protein